MSGKVQTLKPKPTRQTAARQASPRLKNESQIAPTDCFETEEVLHQAQTEPQALRPQALLQLQCTAGNRAINRLLDTRTLQAKLTAGAAHDPYEEEADQVAEQVMRLPASSAPPMAEEDAAEIRTKRASRLDSFDTGADFESRLAAARGSGSPLPDPVRKFMEPRLGADFSGVRIHTGRESAQLNREVSAQAFTQGSDIYLGEGRSDLASNDGRQLLAHELAHTLQQGAVPRLSQGVAASGDVSALQRRVEPYKDETDNDDMKDLAGELSKSVDLAKAIVDTNPFLTKVPKRTEGYLKTWVATFEEFTKTGEIPAFFYARYGYAIETLATGLFLAKNHNGYQVNAQSTYGSTRPDFVIRKNETDIAWIDITSEGSKEHIYDKQGGGWKTRPYVAEVLYSMPAPAAFADTAKGTLTSEQVDALKQADQNRAQREFELDKGMRAMGQILGEAYAAARKKKGEGLSKTDVKNITVEVCRQHLNSFVAKGVTPKQANGVLASIESLEVAGGVSSGLIWANWAFGEGGNRAAGRAILWSFGKA